jgi:SRSO17 transposase
VRDDRRRDVRAALGQPQAVRIVDATGFLKTGPKSAGVARPSAGTAGHIDHGQRGVFLAYARPTGRTGLDRARHLPQAWWADRRAVTGPGCLPRSHARPHRR